MEFDTVEVGTFCGLIELAREAESEFGEVLWYRGHASGDWKLLPSAFRRAVELEAQMAHLFRLRAPSINPNCPPHSDFASWLPLMRHYGLPTRLLDWTESLAVAAYFAVADESNENDGAIWVLSPSGLNETNRFRALPFLLSPNVSHLVSGAFEPKYYDEAWSVLAPRTDPRMIAQKGNYTIHGNNCELEGRSGAKNFLQKIVIPKNAKLTIRRDLNFFGISLSTLFPDLHHLGQEISDLRVFGEDGEDVTFNV